MRIGNRELKKLIFNRLLGDPYITQRIMQYVRWNWENPDYNPFAKKMLGKVDIGKDIFRGLNTKGKTVKDLMKRH